MEIHNHQVKMRIKGEDNMRILRLPKTLAVLSVGLGLILTGCYNNHADTELKQPELTPEIVENKLQDNFDASIKPDIAGMKENTCLEEYESYKTYVGASTDEEVQESLTGPDHIKPRNFAILEVCAVSSHDGTGQATVHSTVENPTAHEGQYNKQESTGTDSYAFEDGRWKFCGSLD